MKYCSIFSVTVKSAITRSFSGRIRDVARRAAEHVLRLGAHRLDLLAAARGFLANGDDGGLVQDDALAADVDQRVGRAKVD
jgi:hypothetical protein